MGLFSKLKRNTMLSLFMILTICGHSYQSCSTKFKLKPSEVDKPTLIGKNTRVHIIRNAEKIKVITYMRKRYTSYCYDGGPLDPNTVCYTKTVEYPLSGSEVEETMQRGMIKIGETCENQGNCWGAQSSICHDESMTKWVDKKLMMGTDVKWYMFAYHTCVSQWSAFAKVFEVPTYVKSSEDPTMLVVKIDNDEFVNVNNDLVKGIERAGVHYKTHSGQIFKESFTGNSYCIVSVAGEGYCTLNIMDQDGIHRNHTIKVNSEGKGIFKNYHLQIVNINDFNPKEAMEGEHAALHGLKLTISGGHISHDDLVRTTNFLRMVTMELQYHQFELYKYTHELEEMLITTISSAAKTDNKVINKIQGKRGYTKNPFPDVFQSCEKDTFDALIFSNCNGNMFFEDGEWRPKRKEDFCREVPNDQIVNVTLARNPDMAYLRYTEDEDWGTFEDSDMGKYVKKFRETSLLTGDIDSSQGEGNQNTVSSGSPIYMFERVMKWFNGLSSIVGWLALFLVIFGRR